MAKIEWGPFMPTFPFAGCRAHSNPGWLGESWGSRIKHELQQTSILLLMGSRNVNERTGKSGALPVDHISQPE